MGMLQFIKIEEYTKFSLWRIMDDGEVFPFLCFKKDGKIIRTPEYTFSEEWGIEGGLLIRG